MEVVAKVEMEEAAAVARTSFNDFKSIPSDDVSQTFEDVKSSKASKKLTNVVIATDKVEHHLSSHLLPKCSEENDIKQKCYVENKLNMEKT